MRNGFKALISETTTFATTGLLNAAQADRFVDLTVDEKVILPQCDVHKMKTLSEDLDRLTFSSRAMRKHTKATKGDSASVSASKRTLTLTEAKLWFQIDFRTSQRATIMSDNDIQGEFVRYVMERAAVEFGNDIEDLGLNGDTTFVGDDQDFLTICNGWLYLAKNEGSVVNTLGDTDYIGTIFPNMVDTMPQKYRTVRDSLRFYVSDDVYSGYIRQIAGKDNSAALVYLTGQVKPTFEGTPVVNVPKMPSRTALFTHPKNLAWGIDVNNIERGFDIYNVSRVIEGVIYTNIGYQVANEQALVIAYNQG